MMDLWATVRHLRSLGAVGCYQAVSEAGAFVHFDWPKCGRRQPKSVKVRGAEMCIKPVRALTLDADAARRAATAEAARKLAGAREADEGARTIRRWALSRCFSGLRAAVAASAAARVDAARNTGQFWTRGPPCPGIMSPSYREAADDRRERTWQVMEEKRSRAAGVWRVACRNVLRARAAGMSEYTGEELRRASELRAAAAAAAQAAAREARKRPPPEADQPLIPTFPTSLDAPNAEPSTGLGKRTCRRAASPRRLDWRQRRTREVEAEAARRAREPQPRGRKRPRRWHTPTVGEARRFALMEAARRAEIEVDADVTATGAGAELAVRLAAARSARPRAAPPPEPVRREAGRSPNGEWEGRVKASRMAARQLIEAWHRIL